MKKRSSLILYILLFLSFGLEAQELPRSIFIGTVNVRLEGESRVIIQNEIDNLSSNRKYLDATLEKMAIYFPAIERILAEEGIPDDFKYLCVQESGLNPEAVSTSNAVGYWQFKRETAQEVGIRVDNVVDERKNIIGATRGAAIYMSRNQQILKNWVSTLLAYRLGLGAVRRMTSIDWAYKNEIIVNSSTDWYVLRFIAYKHFLEREYKRFQPSANKSLYEYTTRGKNLNEIADELGVSMNEIRKDNVWLQSTSVPYDKDYVVCAILGSDKVNQMKTASSEKPITDFQATINEDLGFPVLKKVTEIVASRNEPIFYEINGKKGVLAIEGDTPESIAERADISLKKFLKYNDLEESDRIIPNEVYYLKRKEKSAMVQYHTVQGYETLWKISQMYGIRMEDLMEKNRITSVQRLLKGRLMWMMATRPEKQSIEYVNVPEKQYTPEFTEEPVVVKPKTKTEPKPDITIIESSNIHPETIQDNQETVRVTTPDDATTSKSTGSNTYGSSSENVSGAATVVVRPTVIPNIDKSRPTYSHKLEPKENYYSLARRFNMSVDEIFALNNLDPSIGLKIGQTVLVYNNASKNAVASTSNSASNTSSGERILSITEYPATQPNKTTTTVVSGGNVTREIVTTSENVPTKTTYSNTNSTAPKHTIITGETLYRVSKIYNVTVEDLKKWNQLTANTVEIGQELIVKNPSTPVHYSSSNRSVVTPAQPKTESTNTGFHIVKAGETVFRVSQINGVTVDDLVKWNNIKSFSISVGQKLMIKK
jgi:membrane-bound lytic murein transglycosylase D